MSSHGSGDGELEGIECSDQSDIPNDSYNLAEKPFQKTDLNNNYVSLNLNQVDLCLPLECSQQHHVQRKPLVSESSTIFDTCSSSSSMASMTYFESNDTQKVTTPLQSIDYKPRIESPKKNHPDYSFKPDIDRNEDKIKDANKIPTKISNAFVHTLDSVSDDTKILASQDSKASKIIKSNRSKKVVTARDKDIFTDGIDLKPVLEPYFDLVYTCMRPHCGVETKLKKDLFVHLKEKHGIEKLELIDEETLPSKLGKLSFKCTYDTHKCGKKLESMNKIANHICKVHLNETVMSISSAAMATDNEDQAESIEKTINFNDIMICPYNECLLSFQFEKALKLHKLKHKQEQQHDASNTSTNDSALKLETGKIHSCEICNARFVRPSHLKSHMKSHIGFKCEYCEEVFPKHSILLSHVFEKHKLTDKIYKCHFEGCNKSYLCKMYLSSHITKSHLKQPTSKLDKQCVECNMKFSTVWLKRQHDEINHDRKPTETKSYKCTHENCNKEFSTSSKLNRHSLTHGKIKKFRCGYEDCYAEFSRQDHLMNHVKFHTNQKPYECTYPNCNALFKYQSNLITHKKTHLTRETVRSESENEQETRILNKRPRKNIYQEFKPIVQVSDEENNQYTDTNNLNSGQPILNSELQSKPQLNVLNHQEFVCQSCLIKFDKEEEFNDHLKSHFDVNKANEKLHDYLMVENQQSMIKYDIDLEDDSNLNQLTEALKTPIRENFVQKDSVMLPPDTMSLDNFEVASNDLMINGNQETQQKYLIQLKDDDLNAGLNNGLKYNHIININSDDEENVMCSVVLENLSGSARTDYKSNHIYIEKYKTKRKNAENFNATKRMKVSENDDVYDKPVSSESSASSIVFSPQTQPSKKRARPSSMPKRAYKKRSNLQKSQSMNLSFQRNHSSLQESLIPQTSLQC